jgi:hypothetical protein
MNDSVPNRLPYQEESKKVHTKSKKHDFLLSAKNLYLTYSNCSLSLQKTVEQLKKKLSSYIVQEWVVVQESHKSGEPHIHVYLKTLKKTNILSSKFLDLQDDLGNNYHGNYVCAKRKNSVIEYILKNIPSKNDPNLYYSSGMSNLIGELADYKTLSESLIILAEKGKILEAMLLLKQEDPDAYLKQGNKIEKRLIDIYKDQYLENQRVYDLENFHISTEMYNSLKEYIHCRKKGENPVLAIVGEARHR